MIVTDEYLDNMKNYIKENLSIVLVTALFTALFLYPIAVVCMY